MSSKTQIKSITFLFVLWLIMAALGLFQYKFISQSFVSLLARILIFVTSGFYLLISYIGRKNIWIAIFALILIIFNPFYSIMVFNPLALKIAYILIALISAGFIIGYYNSYHKGVLFEEFVAERFPDGIWTIVDRTKDSTKKLGRRVESDQNPDFIFRHNTADKKIAVECKFRSYFYKNGIEILKNQLENYKNFSQKENIPVLIAVGIGNSPKSPNRFFIIPLEKAENLLDPVSGAIPKSKLKEFEIDSKKEFVKPEI